MQLSDTTAILAIVSFCVTVLVALGRVLWLLARLDFKVETMWKWMTTQSADRPKRGRRRTDLPMQAYASDKSGPPEK